MKYRVKTKTHFVIDPQLISKDHSELLVRALQEEKIKVIHNADDLSEDISALFFLDKKNLRKISRFKNKMIVLAADENNDHLSTFKLNFNSFEDISLFVENFFHAEKILQIQERIKESEKYFEKIRKALEEKSINGFSVESKKTLENIIDLELHLLKEDSVNNWNTHFKNFIKKQNEIYALSIMSSQNLIEDDVLGDDNTFIFKLSYEDYFLYIRFKNYEIKRDMETIDLIMNMISRSLHVLDQKLVKSDGEIDFWKKIFSKIPYPMAVVSSLGDLLIYNESFAKMGILPKECLRYRDQESIELDQSYYKVRRIDFPINLLQVSYLVFYTAEKNGIDKAGEKGSKKAASIDELGIISSSIAHELNNPLAGILAAISLLSLEDTWSEDALSDLEDMKNGAKRCKELIEIFLGFSKFAPGTRSVLSIKDSLDQAINLLRFRMIESNLRVEMKYSPTLENFSHQINSSIMSMILYLICSELMTAFAHHRLIAQANQGFLSGEVLEFSNQIVIKLDSEFEYEDKIAQSKLIQHLLIFEKLEINFLKHEIRLIHRS